MKKLMMPLVNQKKEPTLKNEENTQKTYTKEEVEEIINSLLSS